MSGARASAIPYLLAHLADVERDLRRRRQPDPRRLRRLARSIRSRGGGLLGSRRGVPVAGGTARG